MSKKHGLGVYKRKNKKTNRKGFDKHKTVCLSFGLYEYGTGKLPHPRDITHPENVTRMKWIPQTLFDSIWIFYQFDDQARSDEFIENMPDVFKECDILDISYKRLEQWTQERK